MGDFFISNMDEVHAVFSKLLPPSIFAELPADPAVDDDTLASAIRQIHDSHSNDLTPDIVAKLLLTETLIRKYHIPRRLLQSILLDGDFQTLPEAISCFWETWHESLATRAFAEQLFTEEASAVVKALVVAGRFPIEPTLRLDALAVLDKLVPTFDILKKPLPANHPALAVAKALEPARKRAVLGFLASIQMLCQVVLAPLELPILMSLGFASPEQIAYVPLEAFVATLVTHGVPNGHAERIHAEAVSVQIRQEQSWMALVQRQSNDSSTPPVLRGADAGPPPSNNPPDKAASSNSSNLSDWFGDLDEVSCLDCCSVTSPAAYFVDLLRMLKNLPDPKAISGVNPKPASLLNRLFARRPDLGDLLLSCRNTTEIVPYIDLVNEALESAVAYLHDKTEIGAQLSLTVHNADTNPDVDTESRLPRSPANIRDEVYDKFIPAKVYPSNVFPYDHSKNGLRRYLEAAKTKLPEVLQTFRADARLSGNPHLAALLQDLGALDSVHRRSFAAETLGMSVTDFVALTHESFYDMRCAMLVEDENELSQEDYEEEAGLLPVAEYWGYPGEDGVDDMLETSDGIGVSFIKKQLLPRLAIDFSTLTEILKSKYMGRRLAVSLLPEKIPLDPSKNVPSQLEGFRLKRVEAGRKLDEDSCHRLDQFVRLWRRLGWSVADTDDAIAAFGERPDGSESLEDTEDDLLLITPNCIEQLAAVVEIASIAEIEPRRVLAIFSQSSGHLLGLPITRALVASTGKGVESLFTDPPPSLSASTFAPLVLASLDASYDDFLFIQKSELLGDSLTLQSLFTYNRICEAARILGSPCEQLSQLSVYLQQGNALLSSPQAFIKCLKRLKLLKSDNWTITELLEMSQGLGSQGSSNIDDSTLSFASEILGLVATFRAALLLANSQQKDSAQPSATLEDISNQALETAIRSAAPTVSLEVVRYLLQTSQDEGTTYQKRLLGFVDGFAGSTMATTGFSGAVFCSVATKINFEATVSSAKPVKLRFDQGAIDLIPRKNGDNFIISGSLDVEKAKVTLLAWPPEARDIQVVLIPASGKPLEDQPHVTTDQALLDIQTIISQIRLHGLLLDKYPMSVQELAMIAKMVPADTKSDLINLALEYDFSRKTLSKPKQAAKFARFLDSLQDQSDPSAADLPTQLGEATVMSKDLAGKILKANFGDLPDDKVRNELRRLSFMYKLAKQVELLRRTNLKEDSVDLLFEVAEPLEFGEGSAGADDQKRPLTELVQRLRSSLISRGFTKALGSAQDLLRDERRKALVQYLIQHPAIRARDVYDEDGLFEFFLIDVQMGCGLDTTRIKQAISTVQLFIHRCLLGMEQDVDGSLINRERWEWMQKYTLWEANRKVFLYPENWIEPTLRESKTQLFRSIEETIMQTNLDDQSISSAIRSYVCGADEIANLSVEAFFWDASGAGNLKTGGSFHFFARTRNAPVQYYYRRMDYLAKNALPALSWTPWEKLPFDIATNSSDDAGASLPDPGVYIIPVVWRGRLLVFFPQLSVVAPASGDITTNAATTISFTKKDEKEQVVSLSEAYQKTKRNVEIKVTWSEYIDGSWLSQKQSHETLTVAGNTMIAPSFDSFRFAAEVTTEKLSIFAYRSASSLLPFSQSTCIGQFILQGPRLTLVRPPDLPKPVRFEGDKQPKTSFGRVKRSGKPDVQSLAKVPDGGDASVWPDLSRPPIKGGRTIKSVTWTLDSSTRNGRAAGLVADAAVSDGVGYEPWFTLPRTPNTTVDPQQLDYEDSVPFYNSLNEDLKVAMSTGGSVDVIYQVMDKLAIKHPNTVGAESSYDYAFGCSKFSMQCVEDATPHSIYNWELGFHIVSLITERLVDLQQFDMALKYAHLVFDPSGKSDPGVGQRPIWRFPPFRDPETRTSGTLDTFMDGLTPSSGAESSMNSAVLAWRRNPFKPHAVAVGRPLAYMKRFVMKYIEALVAAGDVLFRQNSLESLPLAIQRYVEASHVFGPAPQKIPSLGEKRYQSFNDIDKATDDFSNASVQLTLAFPYFVPLDQRGQPTSGGAQGLQGFPKTRYFGVQANPEFIALRKLVDDRLYKIRNGLDVNGNPRTLALWDPPLNVRDLVLAAAGSQGGGIGLIVSAFDQVMPRQRFQYLLQRAFDLCAELKQTGAALLNAVEKRDGESLQNLRLKQDTGLQRILFEMKTKQKIEAEKGLEQLDLSRRSAAHKLLFYASLTGDDVKVPGADADFVDFEQNILKPNTDDLRLTENEKLELSFGDTAAEKNRLAYDMEISAASFSLVPMPAINSEPMGIGMTFQTPSLAIPFQIAAAAIRGEAASALDAGQRASRIAGWTRQLQERRLQMNLAGQEIKNIDKQLEVQKARIDVIQKDITSSQQMIDNAVAAEEFMRSKFTNEALYAWYEGNSRSYHYQTYIMAMELAKKVEAAYRYELGPDARPVLSLNGYWDQGRRGLQSGEQLWFALKQMETTSMNHVPYDFELTKHVSLRQLAPGALVQLRELGSATFDLPELLYDLDFPGHYWRRIKSVAFSVHCVAGPYTSINLTATLQKHRFRVDRSTAPDYLEQSDRDKRFIGQDIQTPITSIALSNGIQDSGTFELNFNTETYQPFEGAGAIGTWKLDLPNKLRQFDYSTISDVVMHIKYTSKDGGSTLREAASKGISSILKQTAEMSTRNSFSLLIDARNDSPDSWFAMNAATSSVLSSQSRVLVMSDIRDRLPFFTKTVKVAMAGLTIYTRGVAGDKISIIASQGRDGKDGISLNATDVVGTLQEFKAPISEQGGLAETGRKLDKICVSGKPWSLTFAAAEGGTAPTSPGDVLILIEYRLIA
ncbi:Fc.00g048850.m01.CDS01 [Cosmosporella sp. VM-42]